MRIDWSIRLGLALIVGVMMGGCAGQGTATTRAAGVMELKVVRTWQDLMNQPVVQVDGEDVRLGLEATRCETGTGVLVYCAPSEQPGMRDVIGPEGEPLGPVYVRVVPAKLPVSPEPLELKRLAKRSQRLPTRGEWSEFYATAARVGAAGAYEVLVQGDDGKIVAKAKIEAVEGKGIPWLTLSAVELTKGPEGNTYDLVADPAVPRWDGNVVREKTEKLPQLSSGIADPGLEVAVADGGGLVKVKSARWVDRSMDHNWLIRWWVNGKPVLVAVGKGEKRKRLPYMREAVEKMIEPREFQFRMNVDRKKLGAGPKDRLEFQLMYCSDGVDFGGGIEVMDEMKVKGAIDLRLSKRLRWDQ